MSSLHLHDFIFCSQYLSLFVLTHASPQFELFSHLVQLLVEFSCFISALISFQFANDIIFYVSLFGPIYYVFSFLISRYTSTNDLAFLRCLNLKISSFLSVTSLFSSSNYLLRFGALGVLKLCWH